MPNEITNIATDTTAVAGDILVNKTAYSKGSKITGSMPNLSTSTNITYASGNTTPVIEADAVFKNTNTDGVDRILFRYNGGVNGYLQNNTLFGMPSFNFGNAAASQVVQGATFTSTSGIRATGTHTCASNVLNFSIVQCLSSNELPVTAEENTIFVITDIPVNGWAFSAEAPIANEGLIWLEIDQNAAIGINTVKENTLMTYPAIVRQYINGIWEAKEAKIYRNGVYSNFFNGYLFNWGSVNEDITGGWSGGTSISDTLYGEYWYAPTTIGGTWKTVNKIDITNYKTLKFKCESVSAYCFAYLNQGSGYTATTTITAGTVAIDISSLTGYYYIYFTCSGSEGGCKYSISQVWLE